MKCGRYVPILKWKRGEQVGLQRLSPAVKEAICPLIEVVPVTWDYVNECPAKTLDAHLADFGTNVANCWGKDQRFFLDTKLLDANDRMADGSHPLTWLLNDCRANSVHAIPVVAYDSDQDYVRAAIEADQLDGRGLCIRLGEEDLDRIQQSLDDLVARLRIDPANCDLIVDIGAIEPGTETRTKILVASVLGNINNITSWRTLTVSATAFPNSLSSVSRGIEMIPRTEWVVWTQLLSHPSIKRVPSYGDYAIGHPDLVEIDPRVMQMSANLRYTGDDHWVVVKGRSVRKYGADQMHDLCEQLVAHPSYAGAHFSWGDEWIAQCSQRAGGPGNAEAWRRAGTNHHLTMVIHQLSNLP